jgi:hypothetical protein
MKRLEAPSLEPQSVRCVVSCNTFISVSYGLEIPETIVKLGNSRFVYKFSTGGTKLCSQDEILTSIGVTSVQSFNIRKV